MNKIKTLIFIILTMSCITFGQNSSLKTIETTSLNTFIDDVKLKIPGERSEKFIEPSSADRSKFENLIVYVLENNIPAAILLSKSVNYEILNLKDKTDGKFYILIREKSTGFRALGTYVIDLRYKRNVVIEVPHPLFDSETPEEGGKILKGIEARGLFISGTHRCANRKESMCTGKTAACGNSSPFKVSDAGHYPNNFFQSAHKATLNMSRKPIAISLHGNNDDVPDILLSDGTEIKSNSASLVNRLSRQLATNVGSCNLSTDKNFNLCGTTNIQGILSNGATGCSRLATKSSGLFLHIEQHINIRRNPTRLINALKFVIPKI